MDNTTHLEDHPASALFAAVKNGDTDCIRLLLTLGLTADVMDGKRFYAFTLHCRSWGSHRSICNPLPHFYPCNLLLNSLLQFVSPHSFISYIAGKVL